jgi:hypothetical protein
LLLAVKGRERYRIAFRQSREPRRLLLQALLADAILSGRARAKPKERILAVVGAPLISEAMAASLEAYAREVAPGQPFGYVDERGLVRLFGPGVQEAQRAPARRASVRPVIAQPRDLFSDLNQWLLKVLIGRRLPGHLIGASRVPASSAVALAAQADVSAPVAWRLFAELRAGGHMDESGEPVRVRDLLSRWRAAALRPQRQVGAVWILPGREPVERLRAALAGLRADRGRPAACLGLFAACDVLGVGHVRGAPVHVYVRSVEPDMLGALGLALAPRGRPADVILRVARWPESVFRGGVSPGGVPATDIVQCWLDVSAEPARGAEQAAYLWRRVLGPALADGAPEP